MWDFSPIQREQIQIMSKLRFLGTASQATEFTRCFMLSASGTEAATPVEIWF